MALNDNISRKAQREQFKALLQRVLFVITQIHVSYTTQPPLTATSTNI